MAEHSLGKIDVEKEIEAPEKKRQNSSVFLVDKYNIVAIYFFLHGISALLPWNMLINAESYFINYKLNETAVQNSWTTWEVDQSNVSAYHSNHTIESNSHLESYRKNFLSYLSLASKIPNIIFQILNLLFTSNFPSLSKRLKVTFVGQILLFLVLLILALIDSSSWPEVFFWITLLIAILFNMMNGIFQNCLYGMSSKFSKKYINFVTLGMSSSGTIVSLFLIASLLISPHPKIDAIYYFTFAICFMGICFFNQMIIHRNKFFLHHVTEIEDLKLDINRKFSTNFEHLDKKSESLKIENNDETTLNGWKKYCFVFQKCWIQLMNTVLIYWVSFIIFPNVLADVRPMNSIIEERFFTPVLGFLFYNVFHVIGNILAEKIEKPKPSLMIYFVLLRVLFIPYFLSCNYLPEERLWPVLLQSDILFALGTILVALTGGYLSSLTMIYSPKTVSPAYAPIATMMASTAVIIGIILGVETSLIFSKIITF